MVVLMFVEEPFESTDCAASFGKEAKKKDVMSGDSNNHPKTGNGRGSPKGAVDYENAVQLDKH